jgi:hypothetical protein
LNLSDAQLDFPQPGAHRFNDPWIVCRVFLLHLGEHVDRLGCEELHATQWVETHNWVPPFSLTLIRKLRTSPWTPVLQMTCFVS